MTEITIGFESLLKVRKGAVDIVDVPDFGFAVVTGSGAPGGGEFAEALQALYAVSYGAHFLLRKQLGQAPRVMPLEALWWVDDPGQQDILTAVALGQATMADTDQDRWRWQAMIMQPDPIDGGLVAAALAQGQRAKAVTRAGPGRLPPLGRGALRATACPPCTASSARRPCRPPSSPSWRPSPSSCGAPTRSGGR